MSTKVLLETNMGNITIELNAEKAPLSVANFVKYVKEGLFDGTVFHRVISNFMIQGGGYDKEYVARPNHAPIQNESKNGLKNVRGSIAMARTGDPHSGANQFFINHASNTNLDYPSFDGWGYAVFGQVTDGLDVVDAIASTPTGRLPPFSSDVPVTQVIINKATLVE